MSALSPIKVPVKGQAVATSRELLAEVIRRVNALSNVYYSTGELKFELAEDNCRFTAPKGGTSTAMPPHVWQPYPSPWLGGGTAPAGQTFKLKIRPGDVYGSLGAPQLANRNVEITVPPNCTDGYYAWLVASLDSQGNLTDLEYDHGTVYPGLSTVLPDSGDLPSETYYRLFYVTSDNAGINDFSNCFATTNLALNVRDGVVYWSPPAVVDATTGN